MINQTYKLEMIPKNINPYVMVSQYDTARQISFQLYENGTVYVPNGSVTVTIGDTEIEATVSDNVVTFLVPEDLTKNSGKTEGEVTVTNDGVMSSCNFIFVVDPTPIEGSESGDSEVISALSVLLGKTLNKNIATPLEELKTVLGE